MRAPKRGGSQPSQAGVSLWPARAFAHGSIADGMIKEDRANREANYSAGEVMREWNQCSFNVHTCLLVDLVVPVYVHNRSY
jgi:hypothetical protein